MFKNNLLHFIYFATYFTYRYFILYISKTLRKSKTWKSQVPDFLNPISTQQLRWGGLPPLPPGIHSNSILPSPNRVNRILIFDIFICLICSLILIVHHFFCLLLENCPFWVELILIFVHCVKYLILISDCFIVQLDFYIIFKFWHFLPFNVHVSFVRSILDALIR